MSIIAYHYFVLIKVRLLSLDLDLLPKTIGKWGIALLICVCCIDLCVCTCWVHRSDNFCVFY